MHGDLFAVASWIREIGDGFVPFVANRLPRLGAPFGPVDLSAGFPVPEQLQMALLGIWGCLSSDPIVVWNLHFLSGYPLAALAFYVVASSFAIRPAFAFGLAIAFAYLPFHSLRYEHLFLSQYWVLAPATGVCLHLLRRRTPLSRRSFAGIVAAVVFVTLWHSYYGYFFTGLLGLVFVRRAIRDRAWRSATVALLWIGTAFAGSLGVSTAHHLFSPNRGVTGSSVLARNPSDTILFGLRPAAVLFPREDHRFPLFRWWRERHLQGRGRIEGITESMGTLGLVGLVLGVAAGLRAWRRRRVEAAAGDSAISSLAGFGVFSGLIYLFASRIGISVAVAYTLSPVFRSTNRISPMLAAGGLLAFGLFLQGRLRRGIAAVGIALALFSVWDQVVRVPEPEAQNRSIASTRTWVREIEARLGSGDVLQLPAVPFPEASVVHSMHDYSHAIGAIYSDRLRWSYGSWRNSPGLAKTQTFESALSDRSRSPASRSDELRKAGYRGVWIDRNGYADRGEAMVIALSDLSPTWRSDSPDGRRVFFAFVAK